MTEDISRREFLRFAASLAATLGLPAVVTTRPTGEVITIVELKLDDNLFTRCMTLGAIHRGSKDRPAEGYIEVTLDVPLMWRAAILVDDQGREWHTEDEGKAWKHGDQTWTLEVDGD